MTQTRGHVQGDVSSVTFDENPGDQSQQPAGSSDAIIHSRSTRLDLPTVRGPRVEPKAYPGQWDLTGTAQKKFPVMGENRKPLPPSAGASFLFVFVSVSVRFVIDFRASTMTPDEFQASVDQRPDPPENLPAELRALWLARKGCWDLAHTVVNGIPSAMGSWIHAHLHRIEGDLSNAAYWYSRAGRPSRSNREELNEEWLLLVAENLKA